MDILDFEDHVLSRENVLMRLDEYNLYCHYLGFQVPLGQLIHSPIRDVGDYDAVPSFAVYYTDKKYAAKYQTSCLEFVWHDHARGVSGNIFHLLKHLFGLKTEWDVLKHLDAEFGLGFGSQGKSSPLLLPQFEAPDLVVTRIRIKSREFTQAEYDWWIRFGITPSLLANYGVKAIECYWTHEDQKHPSFPRKNKPGYAYPIWDKYKLYFPQEEKSKKFRSSYTTDCVEGFLQLKYNQPLLIITKSLKDVMCLRSLGYEAVAARSENTMLNEQQLAYFKSKYPRILVLFDNDGKGLAHKYPFEKIWIPLESGCKDISDYHAKYGKQSTNYLLLDLCGEKILI